MFKCEVAKYKFLCHYESLNKTFYNNVLHAEDTKKLFNRRKEMNKLHCG